MTTNAKLHHRMHIPSGCAVLSLLLSIFLSLIAAVGAAAAEAKLFAFTDTGARYWTWALTQPTATNPLTDTTGQFCGQGQAGKTWFLAGTLSPQPVDRTCTVPTGKNVVFPVVNNGYFAFADDPPDQRTETFVRSQVAFVKDQATAMKVSIDGRQLPAQRIRYEESGLFSITLPGDNLLEKAAGFVLDPSVDAGFYVHLDPLERGRHLIHFHGEVPGVLTVDVTYRLTVAR